jgi:hypothetical protein
MKEISMDRLMFGLYYVTSGWDGLVGAILQGINVDKPNPAEPPDIGRKIKMIVDAIAWLGGMAGVAGIIITGVMMALSHKRGESSEHMSRLGMVLGGCALMASAAGLVGWLS